MPDVLTQLRRRQAALSWLLSVARDPILRSNLRAELAEIECAAAASMVHNIAAPTPLAAARK